MYSEDEIFFEGIFKRVEEIFSAAKDSIKGIKIKVNKEYSLKETIDKTQENRETIVRVVEENCYRTLNEELRNLKEKIDYNLDEIDNKILEELAVKVGKRLQKDWPKICFEKEKI